MIIHKYFTTYIPGAEALCYEAHGVEQQMSAPASHRFHTCQGRAVQRHAEGARPPRRRTYIWVTCGLLSQRRSSRFPLWQIFEKWAQKPKYRRRKILCIDNWDPFVSPLQCWVRSDSDTPSSACKFIIPPAFKPNANIEAGMQGVCDNNFKQNTFRLQYLWEALGEGLGFRV